jgi:putative pyruvate formate lyase activating enzyme
MKDHEELSPYPSYLGSIDFPSRVALLRKKLERCCVCPFHCGVNRMVERSGKCRSGAMLKIASWSIHFGEEPPISGVQGSGTIFLSGCSLACSFCENYPISHYCNGDEVTTVELADHMLELQEKGAHNINFVTPTHFVPQIVESVWKAIEAGLCVPIVYNSGGYDDLEVLGLLDGIVDIYLPDMKYGDNESALQYSRAKNYVQINQTAIREMYRQVGELVLDDRGVALKGTIIRHLVLPRDIANTQKVLEFIAGISPDLRISLMGQYFPAYKAWAVSELGRKLNRKEYQKAVRYLDVYGLKNGWVQAL